MDNIYESSSKRLQVLITNEDSENEGSSFSFQCPAANKCCNLKCFWAQRNQLGLEPFPMWFDKEGGCPGMEKNEAISKEFGESYFPEWEISVGTNCMYANCKDFK